MSEVSASKAQNLNSQTFLTALVTNAAILGVELVVFIILKHRLTRIYEPRTYLPPPEKRAVDLPSGPWKWLLAIIAVPTQDVLHKNGVDAYMFLRFLRLLIILFGVVTIFTWLVLLPVDAVNLRDALSADGLVKLSWTNIPPTATKRYAAHIIIVYLSTFFTFYLIRRELQHYTTMRQSFLTSRSHSKLAQARTVLITNIPLEMCNEKALKLWASFVPGGIQNIWIYRDTMDLNKDHQARLDACSKLEAACSKLIRQVVQAKRKEDKAMEKAEKAGRKQAKRKIIMVSGGGVLDIEAVEMKEARQEKATIEKREDIETTKNEVDIAEGDASTTRGYSSDTSTRPFGLKRVNTNDLEAGRQSNDPPSVPSISRPPDVINNQTLEHKEDPNALLQRFVPPNKRPRHRLGFLGLWGHKVDTIEWSKEEIRRLNQAIDEKRKKMDKDAKPLGSAFIQCNLQLGAHVLAQCVSYHEPLMMSEKFIEISPKDVIWDNIDDGAYETRFRYVTSWIATIGLIILWFFPVAIVGTLSNVSSLCQKVSWLCWIPNAPTPIPGIIQGILPPLFLAILFAILPQILRGLAWYENIPRWSLLSMSVYKRYYLFLVIHGFLVITLSSGIAKTASDIVSNPTQAVSLLAAQLPGASIFFLTWTITQGLTGAGSALLQVGVLLLYFIKKWFLGRTPRQAYGVTFLMPKADFGLVLPRISLLATIALAYSVLSPIINGLAMVAFMLFFFSWKFLLTWVFDQPEESETGGQYFPLAINFLFVGLYIEQFCLAALFFLKISQGIAFLAQGILMLVLMGLTVSVQVLFQKSFEPITTFLPMSLATKKMEERWEHDHKIHRHESVHQPNADSDSEDDGDFDLFSRQHLKSVLHRRIRAPVKKLTSKVQREMEKKVLQQNGEHTDESDLEDHTRRNVSHEQRDITDAHAIASGYDGSGLNGPSSSSTFQPPVDFPEEKEPRKSADGASIKSRKSTKSNKSAKSSKSVKSSKSNRPTFAAPAPALRRSNTANSTSNDRTGNNPDRNDEDEDEDADFDEYGFNHPSTYTEQPWIWIPKDELGLSEFLVKDLQSAGVDASDVGANMDKKGNVEVVRNPPDEEWTGGHDA